MNDNSEVEKLKAAFEKKSREAAAEPLTVDEFNAKMRQMEASKSVQSYLEITEDPTTARSIIWELIQKLRGPDKKPPNRATALAVTKLQEARYWLGEALFGEE